MRSEWKESKLSDIADIQTGPFGSQLHQEDYVALGTPIVTVEHLGNKSFTMQNLPQVSDEDKKRLKKYVLNTGDIVFSRVGSVDRCSYVKDDFNGWMFSGRCLRVRSKKCNIIDSEYLYYYFTGENVKQFVRNIAVGATMPSINTSLLGEVPIALPPRPEQRAIAATLSCLNDKIELNNKINVNLEAQAQAIFKSWFVDFEPFQDGEFVESELGMIPKGWRVGSIADFTVDMKNGGTPNRKKEEYWSSKDVPWIKTGEIRNQPIIKCEEYISLTGLEESSAKLLPINSVLIALYGATAAQLALLRFEASTNQACCAMICKSSNSAIYLYLDFLSRQNYIKSLSVGSAQQNLSKDTIANLPIIIPTDNVIDTLPFELLYNHIESNMRESTTLAALRDTLLPKLMSGEIEVPIDDSVT